MCGIVGYVGEQNAVPVLISGLQSLEYRGYDSAGVAVLNEDKIGIRKTKGKVDNLRNLLLNEPVSGHVGIGHTRWATHGKPSKENVCSAPSISTHLVSKGSSGAMVRSAFTTRSSPRGPIRVSGSVRSALPIVSKSPGSPLIWSAW